MISQDIQQQESRIFVLHEHNKRMSRLLRSEAEHIQLSLSLFQTNGPALSQSIEDLKVTANKYSAFREEMRQQEDLILRLAKFCEASFGRFDKHTTQMLTVMDQQAATIRALESENSDQKRTICESNFKQSAAEYRCQEQARITQEQTRVAASMESKLTKLKEVLNRSAHVMLQELDYQDELIDNLPANAEFFQPSHRTMTDMVENIEHWTADDADNEMTFEIELEPDLRKKISGLKDTIDLQSMKLDYQKRKIAEQTKIIGELEAQNRKLGANLEEAELEVVNLMEKQCPNDEPAERSATM